MDDYLRKESLWLETHMAHRLPKDNNTFPLFITLALFSHVKGNYLPCDRYREYRLFWRQLGKPSIRHANRQNTGL